MIINNSNGITNAALETSFYTYLKQKIETADTIDWIVSFIKPSGVKLLKESLIKIKQRQIPIRIITGTYLGITDPAALYMLKNILGDSAELYFYNDTATSFHPKAYFFTQSGCDSVFIGSSNLSYSALMNGVEWNYHLEKSTDPEAFNYFRQQFNHILENQAIHITDDVLKQYEKTWRQPKVNFDPDPINFASLTEVQPHHDSQKAAELIALPRIGLSEYSPSDTFEPNNAQLAALYELKKLRQMGADKAMVVAATGIGKTYLAAFDTEGTSSNGSPFNRVLFIAHREELLTQAEKSFKHIRPYNTTGLITGDQKSLDRDLTFATVQTLSKQDILSQLAPDAFDYIVIDEFHHAASSSYKKVLQHFRPAFLFGITATPHRLDNENIFAICDYNIAYEVDLFSAINKGWLTPFQYYGIHDNTIDYGNITFINGKYNDQELEKALSLNERAELILTHYKRYPSKQALGFCMTIKHAEKMAAFFSKKGIPAAAVHSKSDNRHTAIKDLESGKLKVLFTVDLFNEGVDIKTLDMVLFLRPTESPTIFLQQLGRGLRLADGKQRLTVLDFIGNHKKLTLLPSLLNPNPGNKKAPHMRELQHSTDFPEGCNIHFDFEIIDLYTKALAASETKQERLEKFYAELKETLGSIPTRVDFFEALPTELYESLRSSKLNPFKNYIGFIQQMEGIELLPIPSRQADFINMIENTDMSKTYKLPTMLSFIRDDKMSFVSSENDLYHSFKNFYSHGQNALDMLRHQATKDFRSWDKKKYVNLALKNPVHFLCQSASDFFRLENGEFKLHDDVENPELESRLMSQMIDAIEFRRLEYFRNRSLKEE